MQYLVYGDLIDSRKLSPKQFRYYWNTLNYLNKRLKSQVPFYILLGDALHGVTKNKDDALVWIEKIRHRLSLRGIKARYVIVPVVGDFSKINTIKKYEKVAKYSKNLRINPLNIPELLLADEKINLIKAQKKDLLLVLKKPRSSTRNKYFKISTLDYT